MMACGAAHAQKAFRQVGMSIEAGTTGLGANLSLPLVTNHLVLTLGYNFPSFTYSDDVELNSGAISQKMNSAIGSINAYNQFIDQNDLVAAHLGLQKIPTDNLQNSVQGVKANVDATINFANYKAMLEYYPTTKSAFHITVGFMYGDGEWLNINAKADNSVWSAYRDVVREHDKLADVFQKHPELKNQYNLETMPSVREAAKISVNNQSFAIDPVSGVFESVVKVEKFKPYVGIGFGSSVPTRKRCGFQMEIGAYYQGKPELVSDQEVPFDNTAYTEKTVNTIVENIEHLQWYPQLTFRWTLRLTK